MAGSITSCAVIADMGISLTGRAQETISGGQLVKVMSGAGITATTTSMTDKIEFALADAAGDIPLAVGMATNNAISGNDVTVQLEGIVRLTAGGAMSPGTRVSGPVGTDATAVDDAAAVGSGIGWGITAAGSGEYVLVKLGKT